MHLKIEATICNPKKEILKSRILVIENLRNSDYFK